MTRILILISVCSRAVMSNVVAVNHMWLFPFQSKLKIKLLSLTSPISSVRKLYVADILLDSVHVEHFDCHRKSFCTVLGLYISSSRGGQGLLYTQGLDKYMVHSSHWWMSDQRTWEALYWTLVRVIKLLNIVQMTNISNENSVIFQMRSHLSKHAVQLHLSLSWVWPLPWALQHSNLLSGLLKTCSCVTGEKEPITTGGLHLKI